MYFPLFDGFRSRIYGTPKFHNPNNSSITIICSASSNLYNRPDFLPFFELIYYYSLGKYQVTRYESSVH